MKKRRLVLVPSTDRQAAIDRLDEILNELSSLKNLLLEKREAYASIGDTTGANLVEEIVRIPEALDYAFDKLNQLECRLDVFVCSSQ